MSYLQLQEPGGECIVWAWCTGLVLHLLLSRSLIPVQIRPRAETVEGKINKMCGMSCDVKPLPGGQVPLSQMKHVVLPPRIPRGCTPGPRLVWLGGITGAQLLKTGLTVVQNKVLHPKLLLLFTSCVITLKDFSFACQRSWFSCTWSS